MVTIEQQSALMDCFGNIAGTLSPWIERFLKAKTEKSKLFALVQIQDNCKQAIEKIKNFDCKNHCFPAFREKCTGELPRWKPNPNVVTERDLRRAEEELDNDT